MRPPLTHQKRGFALIVTLFLVTIVTILVIACVITTQTERMATQSMANDAQTKVIAQDALVHAISILDGNIPQPVPPGVPAGTTIPTAMPATTNWMVNPGLLTLESAAGGTVQIPLSSNPTLTYTPVTSGPDPDPNLNIRSLYPNADGNYEYAILGSNATPMQVAWINILKDPTQAASATNPIVGRYAFWIDDECAKINLNMAYGKPDWLGTQGPAGVLSDPPSTTVVPSSFNWANPLWNTSSSYRDGSHTPITAGDLYGQLLSEGSGSVTAGGSGEVSPHGAWADPIGGPKPPALSTSPPQYPAFPLAPDYYDDIPLPSLTAGISMGNVLAPIPGSPYALPPGMDPQSTDLRQPCQQPITQADMANDVGALPAAGQQDSRRFFPLWHPSAINLDVLGPPFDVDYGTSGNPSPRERLADWIFNGNNPNNGGTRSGYTSVPNYRLLSSPDQIKQFVPSTSIVDPESFYQNNKFYLTTSSRAPEFNVFGKSRIFFERSYADLQSLPAMGAQPDEQQPIFFQPDFDFFGPTYFHGLENSWFNTYPVADATGIEHVADALSNILNQSNWPGMPAGQSFVSKWGGGTLGKAEADQVAWNIAMMGNYAEYPIGHGGSWNYDAGWSEGEGPQSVWLLYPISPKRAAGSSWMGQRVPTGILSGQPMIPYVPRPMIDKIAFVITPYTPLTLPDGKTPPPPGTFYLQLSMEMEFYLPQRVPLVDINYNYRQRWLVTHLDYTATDAVDSSGGSIGAVSQTADDDGNGTGISGSNSNFLNGYLGVPLYSWHPTGRTFVDGGGVTQLEHYFEDTGQLTLPIQPGSYTAVKSNFPDRTSTNYFYLSNGGSLNGNLTSTSPAPALFSGSGTVTFSGHIRIVSTIGNSYAINQMLPVGTTFNGSASQPSDCIPFSFTIDLSNATSVPGGTAENFTRTLEIADARLGGLANKWQAIAPSDPFGGSEFGSENQLTISNGQTNTDKQAYLDSQAFFYNESPRGSIGMLSLIPTGMQRGIEGSTLSFQPSTNPNQLPDWLLLDLLAPSIWPHTFMNSTMGKININADIYPKYFGIQRWAPLQAVFQYMGTHIGVKYASSQSGTSLNASDADPLVQNIINHNVHNDYGLPNEYDYVGKFCETVGAADGTGATAGAATDWDREFLIRNLANVLTTQSNTFTVWGIAQSIKKSSAATANFGSYDPTTDQITGERRFQSVVERYVWPGIDGVPGNGHISGSGATAQLDRIAVQPGDPVWQTRTQQPDPPWVEPQIIESWQSAGQWAQIDGPDKATYWPNGNGTVANGNSWIQAPNVPATVGVNASLLNAYNPIRAWMRYRVSSYNYLNEY